MRRSIILNIVSFCIITISLLVNYYGIKLVDKESQLVEWYNFYSCVILCLLFVILVVLVKGNIEFRLVLTNAIILVGVIESVYAFCQLHGYIESNHDLFNVTGSFYNPGPLGGYISICAVIALNQFIENINQKNKFDRFLVYYSLLGLLCMLSVLPSTMSRTSWIAFGVASIYVMFKYFDLRKYINIKVLVIFFFVILSLLIFFFIIKVDSALGRIFIWKISLLALCESPFIGHGNFPKAYMNAQENYFCQKKGIKSWEFNVADCPQTAFNDYLTISVEHGVIFTIFLIILLLLIINRYNKQREYGFAGALIAFSIFAFASYPLRIPAFISLISYLLIYSFKNIKKVYVVLFSITFIVYLGGHILNLRSQIAICKDKEVGDFYYYNKRYYEAYSIYAKYSEYLNWNVNYLFNYGHTLHKIGKYEESNKILFKAQELSNDVMILNIIGKNFFEMKDYEQSKFYLRRSMRILPNRIYSVYLLYNVIYQEYFETYNINLLADLDELARIVLNTKFKIENSKTSKFRDSVLQKHLELRK